VNHKYVLIYLNLGIVLFFTRLAWAISLRDSKVTMIQLANIIIKLTTIMKPENNVGIKRIVRATGFSICGLKSAWRCEAAFRQELILALCALPLLFTFDLSKIEQAVMLITLFIVLIVELLNSAIEAVVDRVGDEIHPLSGQAKDVASAAVMLSLVLCAVTWALILWPHIKTFF
jgi:diacylglycerol kinase (ATP)